MDRESSDSLRRVVLYSLDKVAWPLVYAAATAAWVWFGGLAHQADLDELNARVGTLMQTQAADRVTWTKAIETQAAESALLRKLSEGQIELLVGWRAADIAPARRAKAAEKEAKEEFRERLRNGDGPLKAALQVLQSR